MLNFRRSAVCAFVTFGILPIGNGAAITQQCEVRMELFKAAAETCAQSGDYCSDVPLYRAAAQAECGVEAVLSFEDSNGLTGSSSSDPGSGNFEGAGGATASDMPEPGTVPESCGYFTKPAYEPVRLNYHNIGAMLCSHGIAYECQDDGNGVKQWVGRANCDVFQNITEACSAEGTC
jgi:hypothetical protein